MGNSACGFSHIFLDGPTNGAKALVFLRISFAALKDGAIKALAT